MPAADMEPLVADDTRSTNTPHPPTLWRVVRPRLPAAQKHSENEDIC